MKQMTARQLGSIDNLNFDCKKRNIGQNMQKFSSNMFNILRKFLLILSRSPLFSLRNLNYQQTLVIVSGLALLSWTTAHAAMPLPYGWYLEANAGNSQVQNKSYPGSAQTSGFGWNVNGGYKFMPYLGAEIGYTNYYKANIDASSGTAGHDYHYSYDLAAKGILPLADYGIEVFAKLGIAGLNSNQRISNTTAASSIGFTSSSHNTTGLYLGAGAEYYVYPQMAVNMQWARAQGDSQTGNLNLLSGGISFLFDY
ncbi:MAG: hypothetical protein A3E83_05150 [Gammaproteobacteria bacterium RIFCSPHIGHO2_12_FULL_41_20]|nr:MAG: hypothetical protein A3E83_05150 [Gammaproteobacteria bacterium RIFCSPHIGHO2_12_FULL_41_20]